MENIGDPEIYNICKVKYIQCKTRYVHTCIFFGLALNYHLRQQKELRHMESCKKSNQVSWEEGAKVG